MRNIAGLVLSVVLLLAALPIGAQVAQGTAFTYQGELRQNNLPVTASVDMVFTLYDSAAGSTVIGSPIPLTGVNAVSVVDGLFTVTLDFGASAFITTTDDARWLAITVSGNALSPRTKIENAPYALTSQLAYNVPAGSIGLMQINATQVQRRVSGTCAAGSAISVINQDGTVSCQSSGSGTITGITPANGSGLTGGGTSGTVSLGTDFSVLQKRVSGTCATGSSVSSVNADGTVACQAAGTGTVTSVTAGNGLTGGTITSSGTLAVDPAVVALAGTTWNLAGNGSLPSGSYLGTTDNTSVTFKVNGVQAGQLQATSPSGGFSDSVNVIFGSSANAVAAGVFGATIGGGGFRGCSPTPCTPNSFGNFASNIGATVSGGTSNVSSGGGAIVGGGNANIASAGYTTVGGGQLNSASGAGAVVGGGLTNKAMGNGAMVLGGQNNIAGGDFSFAAGHYAHVRSAADIGGGNTSGDQGSFVWSDSNGSSSNNFTSTGPNQYLVRALGGVGINTTPQNSDVELTIQSNRSGNPSADLTMLPFGTNWGFDIYVSGTGQTDAVFGVSLTDGAGYAGMLSLDHAGNLGIAGGTATKPGGGSWSAPSDIRLKRDVLPLDRMLDRLLQLRGVSFEYKQPDNGLHPAGRHTGFIAQEVQEVFPEWIGHTPDGYLSVGPQGFEAMTVEALRELRAEKDAEIAQLKSENDRDIAQLRSDKDREIAQLSGQLRDLAARVNQLRAVLTERSP